MSVIHLVPYLASTSREEVRKPIESSSSLTISTQSTFKYSAWQQTAHKQEQWTPWTDAAIHVVVTNF